MIGISTAEGVVLVVEKRITSPLMEPRAIEKIAEVDKHVGLASSGLTADSKTLIDRARLECQNHWFTYNESMGVESVAQGVSNLAIKFGDDGDGDDAAGAMVSIFLYCYSNKSINILVDLWQRFHKCFNFYDTFFIFHRADPLASPYSLQVLMNWDRNCIAWTPRELTFSMMPRQLAPEVKELSRH